MMIRTRQLDARCKCSMYDTGAASPVGRVESVVMVLKYAILLLMPTNQSALLKQAERVTDMFGIFTSLLGMVLNKGTS